MIGLIGEKIGMTQTFSEKGKVVPVTVLKVGPCYVINKKSEDRKGYSALQIGYKNIDEKRLNRPVGGYFKKLARPAVKILREFKVDNIDSYELGQELKVGIFKKGDKVDVRGLTKGRGFTGTVKRHGFAGGPKSHGQSDRLRAPGSIGGSSYPSRVFPGTRMAGRMGGVLLTAKNLEVVDVMEEDNILLVKGSIPGRKKGLMIVTKTKNEGSKNEHKS